MNRTVGRTAGILTSATAMAVLPSVSAAAAPAQAQPCVQKVAVVNNAGFVLSWTPTARTGEQSAPSDDYPINQTRIIDLSTTAFAERTDVRPYVQAVGGTNEFGSSYVSYCDNGQTATYTVTGTTFDYSVTRLT
ncbi:hypothetical protein FE633_08035 [Streptomyces montanus]|uniref:Fibronectin type III domain-containing protein n=1 Tax=Streptomyces montanus TaxID=2580423 RepID=A0A5R9FRN0_9ACTN|nr:hypothetical protein [Streptomyces montanus]TLS46637.1 hypothetical protein FE633_08035 [Streptomyces montanus]